MAKTVVGLFDTFAEAQGVVQSLIDTGVDRGDISLVANDARGEHAAYTQETGVETSAAAESAGAGAVGGTVIGGVLGLLVGVGALAIPGIGPVIAAGSLATTLGSTALGAGIGAAAGGLVGALVGAGVPEEDANVYSEGVRRGGTLVTVNAADAMADSVYSVMNQHGAVDIKERGTNYRSSGWDRFDPEAGPHDAGNDWERSSKVGTAGGTAAGAATGAAIGSVGGPVGTVIGGLAGAAVGAGTGAAGDVAGRKADDADGDVGELDDPNRSGSMSSGSTLGDAVGSDRTTPGNMGDDWERSSKVGTAGGTAAGAATGAALGSVAGPVGTVVGGIAGAVAGAGAVGDAAGRYADDQDGDVGELDDPNQHGSMSTSSTSTASTMPIQDDAVNTGSRMGSTDSAARVYSSDAGDDWERSSKVGTAGGTAAGAATGAAMGSVAGPVGTVIGGLAGAAVGAGVGAAGDVAGREADDADGDMGEIDDPNTGRARGSLSGSSDAAVRSTGNINDDMDYARERGAVKGTIAEPDNTSGLLPGVGGREMDRNDVLGTEDVSLSGARDVSDTYKSESEQDWEKSSKLGTGTGAASGAATGAAIGAVGGPVGAALGGVIGAAAGAGVGAAGDVAGERAEDGGRGAFLGNEPQRQRDAGSVDDFDSYDADFRQHYQDNYATSGYAYDQYNQVYRYGYSLGADQRYRNSEWDVIEREAHNAWEERNPGTWDQFKGAIQYAWAKARGHMA